MSDSREGLANRLSKWDWKFFFQVAHELGDQFNDNTWRFLKAEVLAIALEISSNGEAEYVDETGYDLKVGDLKIEVKTVGSKWERAFTKKLDTTTLRMKNTMGKKQKFLPTFDYLVVANSEPPYLAALATWDDVYQGHKRTGDAVTSKIKKQNLNFLTPEFGIEIEDGLPSSYSIRDYVREGIRDWVMEIKKTEKTHYIKNYIMQGTPELSKD